MWKTKVQTAQNVTAELPFEQKRRKRQAGLTLVEMMAVVVILSIVGGVGFIAVTKQIEDARVKTDMANIRTILNASQRYIMDHPSQAGSLNYTNGDTVQNVLVNQGYLAEEPKDPWDAAVYTITVTLPNQSASGTIKVTSPHTLSSTGVQQFVQINY
ncbi:competence type IV pilus major pilin ComGC [Effusibacillus pohliae]|uniref:competence type IV pilus major pilin ComGC n=1 Tax=Effusibacillus pohliae TaxID=232270 RepID=UPI000382659B|nr:prepilin-type N-terminal cleavage/methylation domain-containing protein [Effusibacillus pohliae]